MYLVVSVHDVAPSTLADTRRLLAALDAVGARPRVLKVVPDEGGRGDPAAHPDLVALLRDEAGAGSEIVLHGYTHRAAGRLRGPWVARVRARLFAPGAAEFMTLDRAEMAARVRAGRETLRRAGFDARGFCPPGWLAPPDLLPVLRDLGFRYYVGMASLRDLATGRLAVTPWIGYVGADPVQERLVGLGGGVVRAAAPLLPVVKVFLHPQGAPASPACRRILRIVGGLVRARRPVTYGDLLAA